MKNNNLVRGDRISSFDIIFDQYSVPSAYIQFKLERMEIEAESADKRNAKNRVKVAIRTRPMIARQLMSLDRNCVDIPSKKQIIIGNERSFKFDRVFKESSTQQEVYEECVRDLVLSCFEGYNAAVLAYGQTGSGKTYTMGTNTTTMECSEEGVIPRVIDDIFNEIDKRKSQAEFTIKASFLQIYNEQIIDLLENNKNLKNKDNGISIREEKDGSVTINGITEQNVGEASQMLALLDKGSLNRTTAATLMNDSSSRSHAIFTIFIEQHPFSQPEEGFITAKFFFVDLAGSERAKKTGASGVTLKEGININLGLLQLGNVISALAAVQKKESQFITYRNSKLTRILQDSLGGNSNTYMIACISPAESNYQESLNTLKYASKAMNIKNKPIINRDPHSAMLNQLRQRIKELEDENVKLRDLLKGQGINVEPSLLQSKTGNDEQQIKKMSLEMSLMERKNEKLFFDLKDEKKRKNQLQIQNYELQRQRDILISLVEEFKSNHPQFQIEVDDLYSKQNIPLIQNYLNKIQLMQTDLLQKQKINNQLQIEYTKLHEIAERNQQLLVKKNQTIYKLAKENKSLRKSISELKKEILKANNLEQLEEADEGEEEEELSVIDEIMEEEHLEMDESFNRQVSAYSKREERMQTEIKSVDEFISQKEGILKEMAQEQMELEMKLIFEMQEKYHQKIAQIEQEKKQLLKQQRTELNVQTTNKLSQKIDSLEIELREYRGKAKEQKQMEVKVTQQSNTIKNLGNEIKNFKLQKIELNRKLKEDKESFMKFKQKRTQQLMAAKKQNMKKDLQIRKLTNQNKKKSIAALKKTDELKKIKKVNDTLKKLLKPVRMSRMSTRSDKADRKQSMQIQNRQLQSVVSECLKNLLLKIDRDFDLLKYSQKCQQINKELDALIREEATLNLKLQQLHIQQEQFDFDNIDREIQRESIDSKMKLNLNELRDRINNLQDNLEFCQRKYAELFEDAETKYQYSFESAILYNPAYDNLNTFREILRAFINAIHRLLIQNYELKINIQQLNIKISSLLTQIEELKQNIIKLNLEHQESISQLREELMFKFYQELQEENNEPEIQNKMSSNPGQTGQKGGGASEKKKLEKKIVELTKNNSKLIADNEMWRRKCNVIQEKYQSMKSLFNKDKFIGIPNREEENNINHPNNGNTKEQKKYLFQTPASYQHKLGNQNSNLMDQLNSMAQQLKSARAAKKQVSFADEVIVQDQNSEVPLIQNRRDFNRYKWECIGTIQAHSSPVLCIKSHRNMLISSANRNIRIWDLEDNKLISDIVNSNLNYFVRSLAIHHEKQLMAAACDKLVTLWDIRQSSNQGVLRGHKQEVRCLHIVNNYLFTGGKGLSNSGSLLVWDLRYLNFNSPMQQKERNQDIFSMTSFKNILYYGSRDHHVRRFNIDTLETLTTFQPPHMDTVTGLAISKGYLISGSKDKNLRLWSLDNSIYNLKSTVHSSNDYINTVEGQNVFYSGDLYHPLFYAGDRTGQVKVGSIIKQKIEFVGGFAHSQSVNSICSLQFSRCTATGSTDKSIKLWQPTNQTFHQIQNNLC